MLLCEGKHRKTANSQPLRNSIASSVTSVEEPFRSQGLMERDQLTHIALVLEVEKHECLYNTTLPDYTRKDLTEAAWTSIANTLKLPVAECKDKWRNIRSTFRRSFKPSRNGKSKRSYYLSRYLNFILPYSKPMDDSIFQDATVANDFMTLNADLDSDNSANDDLPTSSQTHISWQHVDEEEKYAEDVKFTPMKETQSKSCRQNVSSEEDFSIPDHLRTITEDTCNTDQTEREHMKYFFLSLLPEFKNMSEKQTRMFKIKVLQLIDDIKCEKCPVTASHNRL